MKNRPFNVFVGTASGLFKSINAVEKEELLVVNVDGVKGGTNRNPVTSLSWATGVDNGTQVIVGWANHTVKIFSPQLGKFIKTEDRKCGDGALVSVAKHQGTMVTAVDSGVVKIWKEGNSSENKIVTGTHLEKMRCKASPGGGVTIATSGKENDLKLWDLATMKQTFNAKNVRHDELELRVPVWVTDIAFLQEKVAVTTKHGHVRLYDPLSSMRRPVVNVQVPEQALCSISPCFKDFHVVVGSGSGQMNLVDLRSKGVAMNKYKGFLGCVKSISASVDHPYIASVSTDRHFRLHHLETKDVLVKEYMQSKLTGVLVADDFTFKQPEYYEDDDDVQLISAPEGGIKEIVEVKKEEPLPALVESLKKDKEEPLAAPPEKRSRSGGASAKKKHKNS
ncbi:WD domain, G-beta repeat [Nesidiocoris tenuis]|uniref:WD domain, G-beta repeat n=1 Tax=Nesidiocoris tenuis TaxID=355587 RepID=A0ABN7A804_9HEMI|nr:WD domain, G-beta repeat [Nesidiocoris tenuis]